MLQLPSVKDFVLHAQSSASLTQRKAAQTHAALDSGQPAKPENRACEAHTKFVAQKVAEELASTCPGCTVLKLSMNDDTGSWTTDIAKAAVSPRMS